MGNNLQRRFFLKGMFFLMAGFSVKKLLALNLFDQDTEKKQYSLNPAYSVRYSGESIFLETTMANGEKTGFEFGVIYADILDLIIKEKHPLDNISELAGKYNLSEDYCKFKCDSILTKMEKEYIIITEETQVTLIKNEIDEGSK